ncbi:unnamed protein product [Danaus chrysippus]|uniref:(African queen) hypothetical protein n=1 Tax=Danaus chrysippus TaxID=151541 RepID=A0A8J2RDV2_9NEOP|nr:unnamed protein product [Danaus chrysippus]
MSGRSDCRKFAPNIFNKSKCTNCFRQKEEHSAEALESNRSGIQEVVVNRSLTISDAPEQEVVRACMYIVSETYESNVVCPVEEDIPRSQEQTVIDRRSRSAVRCACASRPIEASASGSS